MTDSLVHFCRETSGSRYAFPMKFIKSVGRVVLLALAFSISTAVAQSVVSADQALRELREAAKPARSKPLQPGKKKTRDELETERRVQAAGLVAAAVKAREFQERYSSDINLPEVRKIEVLSLLGAVRVGDNARESETQRLAQTFIADSRNPRRDRYFVAAGVKQWATDKKGIKDRAALLSEHEKTAAELYADFADVPEVYYLFIGLARHAPEAKARLVLKDLLAKPVPDEIRMEAQLMLDRLDLPGKALDLKFLVNDGTEFELAKYKGKPVVIYFWASWGNGGDALASVRTAARENKAAFVGVNLDVDPRVVRDGLAADPLPGVQRWEPRSMNGGLARQLCVTQMPSVYVFDREGVLRGFGHARDLATLLASVTN